jgi:signal transduction histidine kinase
MDKPQGWVKIGFVEEDGWWKFSVSDNGPGIEEKYFEKIFQIFQTLARRDDKESTGIGLSIVKKIIEAHGGKVWVESKVGEGSTFYFTVPKNVGAETNEELEAHLVSGR